MVFSFIEELLLGVQNCMDENRCCRLLLQNNMHSYFIEAMQIHDFDPHDTNKMVEYNQIRTKKLNGMKKRLKFPEEEGRYTYFKQENRKRMIVAMVCEATEYQFYDIACEVTQNFMSDLIQGG